MSKQEDILFCNIAIQNGLVTQQDAKRCLALAEKIESQGKRRPRIGAIFVKANLLDQQNAQRIYQAVQKRQGGGGTATGTAVPKRGVRRGKKGAAAGPADAHEPRVRRLPKRGLHREKVSQKVLWLYIASGIGFIVLIMGMVYMLIQASFRDTVRTTAATGTAASDSTSRGLSVDQISLDASQPAQEEARTVDKTTETYRDFENRHRLAIMDARQNMGDGLYARALLRLQNFKNSESMMYKLDPEKAAEIDAEIQRHQERIQAEVDAARSKAEQLAASGMKSEAIEVLEKVKENVDLETQKSIQELIDTILQ